MEIGAKKHQAKRNGLGFTLIELLVVIVIIGIVIAAATFFLKDSGQGQTVRSAVNSLQQRILLAEQRAILTGSPLGFAVSQSGYQFYQLTPPAADGSVQWQLITTDRVLAYQPWPRRVAPVLNINGQGDVSIPTQLPAQPMIILNASAMMTPFQLTLDHFTLQGQLNGDIQIEK